VPTSDVPVTRRRRAAKKTTRADPESRDLVQGILEVAQQLLVERGLDKLTVTDIIERAGVARTTFYGYFESKHGVVSALAEKIVADTFEELWHPWLASSQPYTLASFTDLWLETIRRWRTHRALLLAAAQGWRSHADVYDRWSRTFERYVYAVRDYIDRARAIHNAPAGPDSAALAALLMWLAESALYVSNTGAAPELTNDQIHATAQATLFLRAVYGVTPDVIS
jgi:AcrR family transcriptional regulator